MIHFSYVLRDPQASKLTPVVLLVRYNGTTTKYATGIKTLPKHFQSNRSNKNYQRLTGGYLYKRHNRILDDLEHRIKSTFYELHQSLKRYPSHAELKESVSGTAVTDFFSFAEQFTEQTKTRINPVTGNRFNKDVFIQYRTTIRDLKAYTNKKVLSFEGIDQRFYEGFVSYLTLKLGRAPGTVAKRIKQLKTLMRAAQNEGLHTNSKYQQFRTPSDQVDKIYLTKSEIKALYKFKLPKGSMAERIRDLFVVGCWTCLRFSDYNKIRAEDVRNGSLYIETAKTQAPVVIPLHPFVEAILRKYNYQLPQYANQVVNRNIKLVAQQVKELCVKVPYRYTRKGVRHDELRYKWELIETHTARRSFATNALMDGVPEKAVMDIGGWKDPKTMRRYIRFQPLESTELVRKYMLKQS